MVGVCALLVVVGFGCERNRKNEEKPAADNGVTKVARGGPVTLTLSADDARPREDQLVTVTLQAEAETGVTVELDDYRSAANTRPFEFALSETGSEMAKPVNGGKLRWTKRYQVQFFLPGEYELPAAKARFVDLRAGEKPEAGTSKNADAAGGAPATSSGTNPSDRRGGGPTTADRSFTYTPAAGEQTVETEPIKLAVASMSDHEPTPEELATLPVPAPMELRDDPAQSARRRWWIAAGAAAVAAAAIAWWYRRKRRREAASVEVVLPAHEWATLQLAALLADDLLSKGMAQEFYYRLSGIVRGYIERRFSVAAEEMTTEEFLVEMARDHRFDGGHRGLLERFLLACDMVKYALYRPSPAESDEAVAAARNYIEETRERESVVGVEGNGRGGHKSGGTAPGGTAVSAVRVTGQRMPSSTRTAETAVPPDYSPVPPSSEEPQ